MTGSTAIQRVLAEALEHDASVVVLGEAVRGPLRDRFGADRVIEVPVSDRATVGLAVGLALGGRRPIVEVSSASRLAATLEALGEAASVARDGEFAAPVVVRVPWGGEAGARIDRPVLDLLAAIPGLVVAVPSDVSMAVALVRAACRATGPVVLLEPRTVLAGFGDTGEGHFPFGTARVLREGAHATVCAWGGAVVTALASAEVLAAEGVQVDVIDLVTLSPIDAALVADRVRATGRLVVADGTDSFGERVMRLALGEAFDFLEAPPVAVPDDAGALAGAVREALAF